MVFLSTLQTLLGSPLTRSVFAFGFRQLTQRIILEEIVMGIFTVFPISILLAQLTIRCSASGWRPGLFRSDVWTTVLITIVGDIFLEILLPSLQCLPMHESMSVANNGSTADEGNYLLWFGQTWGFSCPDNLQRDHLLSPDSVGTILTIRLIFMCLGVYLGESFLPVALTGGIATGKSTVANMLLDPKPVNLQQSNPSSKTKKKKPKSAVQQPQSVIASSQAVALATLDEEGSFLIIDTDTIGHEILLPPAVLAGEIDVPDSDETTEYTVHPNDSVFNDIVDAFGDEDADNKNLLDENGLIDRRKLGAVIFQDPPQRRVLNGITHPRIIIIMLKRILYGIFFSNEEIVCADVPLLFESGQLRRLFGITILVACDPDKQLQRLRKRNPDLTEQQCQDRIASQLPIESKAAMADIVIWNNGDLESLSEEVERVRRDVMGRIFGVGMSLLQMLLLVGGSLSLAVSSKLFMNWG